MPELSDKAPDVDPPPFPIILSVCGNPTLLPKAYNLPLEFHLIWLAATLTPPLTGSVSLKNMTGSKPVPVNNCILPVLESPVSYFLPEVKHPIFP
ncbi:MAG TPA: hypothetical protein PLB65_05545 [Candidatus Cloacimonas sp.]|nr:hypothetical protein [Candidatus Cloacimonas sp.]